MVVIKEALKDISDRFGAGFVDKIKEFSRIIGFSVEVDEEVRVEFNPDRHDLFSFVSLDRMQNLYFNSLKENIPVFKMDVSNLRQEAATETVRQFIVGFTADGPKIGKDLNRLIDFQEKLHLSVGRNRKSVSIGLHDASKLKPPFSLKAMESESFEFETYDSMIRGTAREIIENHPKGKEYASILPDIHQVAVLFDSSGKVLSMPPLINGKESIVTENTSRFFVDITGNSLPSIRAILFDLAYLFHYLGYSVKLNFTDSKIAEYFLVHNGRQISIPKDQIDRVLGIELSVVEVSSVLERMGYSVVFREGFIVQVPGNRSDVMGPVDIIEDIAKGKGYDTIPSNKPLIQVIGNELPVRRFQNGIRDLMLGLGYQETMSYVVTSSDLFQGTEYNGKISIENPKSLDFSVIRDRLYLNMLDFFRLNKSRSLPQRIFEIGDIIQEGVQKSHLCIAAIHNRANYSEIRSTVDYILKRLDGRVVEVSDSNNHHFIPGRSGIIQLDGRPIGYLGEVAPGTLVKFELQNPAVVAEINLEMFIEGR
jgi:phenylalanyl-tRNA synthetase beta chain